MTKALVIVCTHNPNLRELDEVFAHISSASQLVYSEVVIVDNASTNGLEIESLCLIYSFRYLFEPRIGLSYARVLGLSCLNEHDLIVFVDDDNLIGPNYLVEALDFACKNPNVIAFGGKAISPPSHSKLPQHKRELLKFLGIRDLGTNLIVRKAQSTWQECEPIGAGLCLSRSRALKMNSQLTPDHFFFSLGRRGAVLLSGEDGVFSRINLDESDQIAYVPELVLIHKIELSRLQFRRLVKLFWGYGKSDAIEFNAHSQNSNDKSLVQYFRLISFWVRKMNRNSGYFLIRDIARIYHSN